MKKKRKIELEKFWLHSAKHRNAISTSTKCWCFHCLAEFTPDQIDKWADNNTTAICPNCGIDAVIGNSSVNLTKIDLLDLRKHFFGADAGKVATVFRADSPSPPLLN